MAVHRTTFSVDAPPELVWGVLVDFGSYPTWNPFLPSITGDLGVGSTVSLTLGMPGRLPVKVKAQLTNVTPPRRLAWHGNVGADAIFAGDREFHVDDAPGGTSQVTHVENVRGALFPLFRLLMGSAIQRHHDGFNESLKSRSEELARR